MQYWDDCGKLDDISKALGYTLVLDKAMLNYTSLASGSTLYYSFTISNTGSAPVVNERPFELVLMQSGTPEILSSDLGDIRTVAAGSTVTFSGSLTLPVDVVSSDQLALWLPDDAAGLQATSAYSIRLANSAVTWSDGYNLIYTF